ncbi:38.7 kDa protein [Adoxophyes orana nucleopolyhedrovirus]|uniref:38.7 kDa protein n=1 Tax=Adoxophyes orana nucleopolyhedrovirus TaxID=542343 RepID=UPI0001829C48|nr:38.7 kDa protein [Adoxophyes orana nucleopolyhedrovirus]ACF05413.1 38.7 kDa protein [Adoxophyes orana nucleopolyhedrovirus]
MLLNMLTKLFSFLTGNGGGSEYEDNALDDNNDRIKKKLSNISYLFQKQVVSVNPFKPFTFKYLLERGDKNIVWVILYDFIDGMRIKDENSALSIVDPSNFKFLDAILPNNFALKNCKIQCCNKYGILEMLESVCFENKAVFVSKILELCNEIEGNDNSNNVGKETENKFEKLYKIIESLKNSNESMSQSLKTQVFDRFNMFETKLAQLDNKISLYENIGTVYEQLREHHKRLNNHAYANMFAENSINVRMPRDENKHPRIAVFVQPAEAGTQIAFVSGQKRHVQKRKHNYNGMELIYENVHPNPHMAVHCIAEDFNTNNYEVTKKKAKLLHVKCNLDTVKSLICNNFCHV